ncbi:MAG: response regulator [Lentisphaeraceae bacterium]|nr:response regulator [Lentisphaeraceae bacterium]
MTGHVLIVDDNINNLRIAVDILIHEKLRITTAKCGADALKALDRNEIDLILLDINMPEMDGFETLKNIHEKPNYRDVPVLFVTSHNDEEFLERGFQSGCVDFISKPFRPTEFIARIKTHLSLSQHKNNLQEIVEEKTILLQKTIEELKASKSAKENFLSIMSHELRTPLSGILGMIELLKIPELVKDKTEIIGDLEISAKRLSRLITDVLDFSTLETPKVSAFCTSVALEDLTTMIEYQSVSRNENTVSFEIDVSKDVPKEMKFDEKSVLKVVDCIVDNAIKFTHDGQVKLNINFNRTTNKEGKLYFTVSDDGPGICEEHIDKIFDKFYQIDSGLDRRYEGSGIGLAIAQKIAFSMDGTIRVESKPGEGSTFSFEVPVTTEVEVACVSNLKKVQDANLLIVEDVPTNQAFLSRLLSLKNANVFIAGDHKECFEIMARQEIDLIFMDYMLPEMDGTEITRKIRKDGKDSDELPIIAVTAKADEVSRDECIQSGMDGFLSKPYSAAEIFAVLGRYFNMDT